MNNIRSERLVMIKSKLEILSNRELDHISYILSHFQESSLKPSEETPMHLFGRFLGIKQLDDGTTEMKLGLQNENTYGVAQGGSIYTLADIAIGFTILKKLSEDQKVFTLEMKVNFIEKGQGSRLIATPSILRWGKNTVVSECIIVGENGNLVAKALGTFYIVNAAERT
ncbi:PaaI family thioesterase [Jeotgalibacillus soli]|uniref:Thioesterase domain-containing protein n=1 Tax=Jeotgalibacillus soli TaxID=889306 RepID=A0A0C2RTT2_9BACL|nr:PaaI family thioesterase [Jeotgalibacillus soli]KIL45149.1 hypothetical protein KP78_26930 [Jeotgalibacillus soli]